MRKARILFVSQEITPYLDETHIGKIGRRLPQAIQERGREIRTFMPKYGNINERRHQLHEVIRLSGMNIVINNADHPLIIKVASIPTARMQVYFIDNDDYFHRKSTLTDKATGKYFDDNDERLVFFNRGVIETVKKLGWSPDIIHCHGWFTGLTPLYVKKAFIEDQINKEVEKAAKRFENFDAVMFKSTNTRVVEYQQKIDEINNRFKIALNDNDLEEVKQIIIDLEIVCPISGSKNWTDVRQFNLMFSTSMGAVTDDSNIIYLRDRKSVV